MPITIDYPILSVRSFDVSYTDPATIVGPTDPGTPLWKDDDDGTYAVAHTPASGNPTSPQGTVSTFENIGAIIGATVHIRVAFTTTDESPGGVNIEWRDTAADPEGSRAAVTFIPASLPDQTNYAAVVDEAIFDLIAANRCAANVFALASPGFEATATVAELYLSVTTDGAAAQAPAPLRLYPRSSTRLYPRRRTRRPGTF